MFEFSLVKGRVVFSHYVQLLLSFCAHYQCESEANGVILGETLNVTMRVVEVDRQITSILYIEYHDFKSSDRLGR